MKASVGYIYRAEGHIYVLDPEMTIGLNRVHLIGAGIYNMQLEYLGYWDRFNMPVDLIRGLTAWYKRERGEEIVKRRTAMLKKERRPRI
jgi:hypothetical protein